MPFTLTYLADTLVSPGRISPLLTLEDLEPDLIDKNLPVAVRVDGDFVWDMVLATGDGAKGKALHGDKGTILIVIYLYQVGIVG